jgi:hypothetical protein
LRAHSFRLGAAIIGAAAGCNALTGVGDLDVLPESAVPSEGGAEDVGAGDTNVGPDVTPPIDAGLDAGPCGMSTFCDDFESGDLSKWTSLLQTNSGKVSVVETTKFAGRFALHATAGPSTPVNGIYPTVGAGARVSVPVVTSGLLAVRARVLMPKILGAETTFLKAFGKNGKDDMNVKITNGGLVKADSDVPDAGPELTGTMGTPVAEWFCIEWQATIGVAGHQRILVNGAVALDADESTFTAEGYDSVQVGFNAANGSVTQEIYFDDVVTATQPIGCD